MPVPPATRSAGAGAPLPPARGRLTESLFTRLRGGPHPPVARPVPSPLDDDDLHLALHCCYELAYRGFAGVDDGREWDPAVLAFRSALESQLETALRADVLTLGRLPDDPRRALRWLARGAGPSLSASLLRARSREHFEEFLVHRSAYQLKEADPHTWALPRLGGTAKAAIVGIQMDEYGGGAAGASHAELFAETLQACGLDSTYGAYVHLLPGSTLATGNVISLFGLHRRLLPALVGHLALFEMTSVEPMTRYAALVDALGLPRGARRFYDVHVAADAEHASIAQHALVGGFLAEHPGRARDLVFGAAALVRIEARFTRALLGAWDAGRTSLRTSLRASTVPRPLDAAEALPA